MRKTLRASALVLALCSPALAGDILNPPAPQPPPAAVAEEPAGGDILCPSLAEQSAEALVSLIQSVLAIF